MSGTRVRRDNDTSVVEHHSDRTVTGLAPGSTQRTVNGTSAGTENITGSNTTGAFTALRTIGDTITGVIIPVVVDRQAVPDGRNGDSVSASHGHLRGTDTHHLLAP